MSANISAAPGHAASAVQLAVNSAASAADGLANASAGGDQTASFATLFRRLAARQSAGETGQTLLELQEIPVATTETADAATDALSALLPFLEGMAMIQPDGNATTQEYQAAQPTPEDVATVLAVPVIPAPAITAAVQTNEEGATGGNFTSAAMGAMTMAATSSTASTVAKATDASIVDLQDETAMFAAPALGAQAQTAQNGRGREFTALPVAATGSVGENIQTEGIRAPGSSANAIHPFSAATGSVGENIQTEGARAPGRSANAIHPFSAATGSVGENIQTEGARAPGRSANAIHPFSAATGSVGENIQTEGTRAPGSSANAIHQLATTSSNGVAPSANGSAPSASTTPLQIVQPVGTSGWSEEVGNRIVWMANRMESHAELVLTPPQMGRVEVSLTISGDQASANFVSANPAVRDALEAALPRLREVLADAGIQLGQAQVGAENPGQSARGDKNDDNPGFGRAGQRDTDPLHVTETGMSSPAGLKSGRGLVDVFA